MTTYATWATIVAPFLFGIIALIAQNRGKSLETVAAAKLKAQHEAEVTQIKKDAATSKTEFTERLRAADERTSEANAKAAAADERARKTEQKVAPRVISTAQRERLVRLLRAAPKGPLRVLAVASDPESVAFGKQFVEVLTTAGWEVRFDQFNLNESASGVAVEVQDKTNVPLYAIELQKRLASVGLPVEIFINANQNPGQVQLFVGHKP